MKKSRKIYILHGWSYSINKWDPFIRLLHEKGFEPVILQIPGLTAPLKEVWKLEDYVFWLKKHLDKEIDKVYLLGHSNGGRISLAYAIKYPEKIEHLILIDSAGIYHNELPLRLKRAVFGAVAQAGRKIRNVGPIRKLFYKVVREHDYERANPILRRTMKNLIMEDLLPRLSLVTVPTLIIWGKHDKITPMKDAEVMRHLIKNSSLHFIKDARHSPQFTHAKDVIKIISETI